jgi:hypothetical protein
MLIYMALHAEDNLNDVNMGIVITGGVSIILGLIGCCGSLFRAKVPLLIYAFLVVILVIAQCIMGGVSLNKTTDDQLISSMGSGVWNAFSSQDRMQYQNDHLCCGYRTIVDRKEGLCLPLMPCGPILEDSLKTSFKGIGIYMIVGAGVEVLATGISLILAFGSSEKNKV